MMEDYGPLPTLRKYSAYGLERQLMRISRHKTEREKVVETIVA
jgi:hypothetical protein